MASIYRRDRIWWAKYRGPDGERKRVSLGTTRRAEAFDLLAELTRAERERRLGLGNGRTNHRPLAPIIEAFMREKEQALRPSTLRNYRLSLGHVLPGLFGFTFEPVGRLGSRESLGKLLRALGAAPVSRITGPSALAWRTKRAELTSARTASMEAQERYAETFGEKITTRNKGYLLKHLAYHMQEQERASQRDESPREPRLGHLRA